MLNLKNISLLLIALTLFNLGVTIAEDARCQATLMLVDFVNCDTQQLRWSYNRDVKQCVQFLGCNRTSGNNFDRIDDCTASCYARTTIVPSPGAMPIRADADRCRAQLSVNDLTRCDTILLRWSYDNFLKRCRQIAGCRRNTGNNFDSMEECDYHCSSVSQLSNRTKSCGSAPVISDAVISRQSFTGDASRPGDFAIYSCNRGRIIEGDAKIECSNDGEWSHSPKCNPEAPCGAPPDVLGATIISQSYSNIEEIVIGDFIEYRCSKGMKMWGQSYIVCQPGGRWSKQPKCQDLAAQNPQLRCTGRLSLADVSFCQLEVRYTFSAIQQRCLPFWGCPREQGNNFPTDEVCKTSCEALSHIMASQPPPPRQTFPMSIETTPTTKIQPTTELLTLPTPIPMPTAPRVVPPQTSCSRPRGPQCIPGVGSGHTSCLDDGPDLLDIACVNSSEIIERHNFWRDRVEPEAVSLPHVQWDDNLATTAERWAAQCPDGYGTGAARSLTVGARQWPWIGQNICFASYDQPWTECIDDWASERERWVYGIGPFPADSVVGHYTQIIWADTLYIGCAKAKCTGSWTYVLVCNYGPGGNVKGVAAPNAWAYPYVSKQRTQPQK